MPKVEEIICIECPLACRVGIEMNEAGDKVLRVLNFQCQQGKGYALQECKSPLRILTATVKTEGSVRRLLPVRTRGPVPKGSLKDCMGLLAGIRVKPPLTLGEVILADILGSGVDLVCCDDLKG